MIEDIPSLANGLAQLRDLEGALTSLARILDVEDPGFQAFDVESIPEPPGGFDPDFLTDPHWLIEVHRRFLAHAKVLEAALYRLAEMRPFGGIS